VASSHQGQRDFTIKKPPETAGGFFIVKSLAEKGYSPFATCHPLSNQKQKNLTQMREICVSGLYCYRSRYQIPTHYSKFKKMPVLYVACSSAENQAQNEQNQEDEEQNLCNTSRTGCNTTEAENGRDNRYN
jgi:hypothetical protein